MKSHTKKKQFKLFCKRQAKQGLINNAAGQWVQRSSVSGSMGRDYSPQSGRA